MKKYCAILLFVLIINSICFANSENISVLLNKQITIRYGSDNSSGSYSIYNDGYYEWDILNNFKYKDYRIFAKSEKDNEYSHYNKEVFPISYAGTTYLPIRSISGLLGTNIAWDGITNSIKIGEGERDWRAIGTDERTQSLESQHVVALRNEDIKIYFDGELQTLRDANGTVVYPLSYEGTTYLPIRACSMLFNMLIDWDGENNTVIITKKSTRMPLIDSDVEDIALTRYSDEELEILLNSFFAKYGHDFDTQRLEDYFTLKSWYKKIDGKKVATTELTPREQRVVDKIKAEVERRKSFKDINEIEKPSVKNILDYKVAEVFKDSSNNNYIKIYDSVQESFGTQTTKSNISKIELLPSKVYLMDDSRNKLYADFDGKTYYIPTEKVNSKDKEKIVLMEDGIEIYNNGDLIINGKKYEDFFSTNVLKDLEGSYPNDLIDYLISYAPTNEAVIGYKYNFDNDTNTSEYLFNIMGEQSEGGADFFEPETMLICFDNDGKEIAMSDNIDIEYDSNIDGYSNVFTKVQGWFEDFDNNYEVKYYIGSLLGDYISEEFIDAYYLFIPGKGFELVNKTLDGSNIDMSKYIFTLKDDLHLYTIDKYKDEYFDEDYLDSSKYDKILYRINENGEYSADNKEYEVIIPKETKVKCVSARGWWNILFESEDGKEAYYIYFTPAGVT